ncbi:BZ3500_MvSof-1268-A1-R1_Chr1-3g02423 [Microbotryum saponariae]|uniref:BZ3500_MvSof-1268-A1-R1_Chr1-3g02423 protein n=1 Tax=Microbotryum saponariae TaxID=289078 RepID=A0A2X0MA32_9BASI|nr:BZ3500_MvSof-1268-A1-R1_Chr1-3g02423 [Microbotryum saponariae]SCZ96210.1 BZ3501_MvSof-1269-A2-R1_Chr1-3g02026 [Microbotryum saponariae]
MAAMVEEIDYEGLDNDSLAINMLAGAMAGISEHAVMYPVDSIKTRMQVLTTSPGAMYTGMSDAFTRIASTEGTKRLWRGVASVIWGAGPAHAVYFGTYEFTKELAGGNQGGYSFAATASAGATATIASDALMNPFDVVKQRMQIHGSTFRGVGECFRSVYHAEGLSAFYVSYPTTLMMTVPFTAVQFSTYEFIKDRLNPTGHYSPWTHVTAGGIAGAVAAAVTTPLDVCKTLLQTRGTSDQAAIRNARGMLDAAKIIWERQGASGFARGISPRILTNMPSNALCWLSYEGFRFLLKGRAAASTKRNEGL